MPQQPSAEQQEPTGTSSQQGETQKAQGPATPPLPVSNASSQMSGRRPEHRRRRPRRRRRRQDRQGGEATGGQERDVARGPAPAEPAVTTEVRRPVTQPAHQRPADQRSQQRPTDISVVIPLYNEEGSLRELYQQLRATLHRMNVRYELLFIDDGSTDNSFRTLRDLKRTDHRVKIIRFRRNYGKAAALSVGFEQAQGNYVITMDSDLQDDPAEIPGLVRKLKEGFDLVSGWKKVRRDPLSKRIPSRFFNSVTARLTGIRIHDFNCGLKAYRREVVKSVNLYGELHRYIPALAHWQGFAVGEMVVQHRARKYGHSKFGIGRFWRGFFDLLTTLFTTRYFRRPLHLFGVWGATAVLAGLVIDGWLVVEWFMGTTALSNRPLFLGGIMLIIVGIQLVSIGLLGEMITKTRQAEERYAIRDLIT